MLDTPGILYKAEVHVPQIRLRMKSLKCLKFEVPKVKVSGQLYIKTALKAYSAILAHFSHFTFQTLNARLSRRLFPLEVIGFT
jgi:hypothetical protein